MSTHTFTAEVRQLLDLVIHSLYSDRDVFLRELISNASDALDRARLEGLSRELRPGGEPAVEISFDPVASTLTVSDNGIGLTADQAVEHLGTIARSGTRAFAEALKQKGQLDQNLIGQFGVGFYSAFMVARKIEVRSLSGEPEAHAITWTCDGSTEYAVHEGGRESRGTDVVLTLKEECFDLLDADRLRAIVRKYSEYVTWPIRIGGEQVNEPRALWTRAPSDVTEEEYTAFYRHVGGDWGEPATRLHWQAEAPLQYRALLFVPANRPWDLNHPDARRPIRLYAKRVLIDEHARQILPDWLRFLRGVVDSEDIPLNVSREMVQKTPLTEKLKQQITSRVLKHFKDMAANEPDRWAEVWDDFGATLKEGLANDAAHRDRLLEVARFKSTAGPLTLKAYVEQMKEGQDAIWYLSGPDDDTVIRSPHLEAFRKKGWEVLLLTDPVDEWVVQAVTRFEDRPLKSVARGELDLDPPAETVDDAFLGWMKETLASDVRSVRASNRLTDSASVLVDDVHGLSGNMERILRQVQGSVPSALRILELNPSHPLVHALQKMHAAGRAAEAEPLAWVLLDQARLAEGDVRDPAGILQRMQSLSALAARALDR